MIPLLLLSTVLTAQQPSVANCGADPAGERDSTLAFAACLERFPVGDLLIPSGNYRLHGTITLNRNQGLVGTGARSSVLKCLSLDSPCIVVADTTGGPNNYSITNLQSLGLEGPGPKTKSIGVYLGGDPAGRFSPKNAFADSVNLIGVRITGFNHGVQWGNNAYVNKIVRSSIFANETALFVPGQLNNSGEAIGLTDSDIFNNLHNGIEDHSNFEWMIEDCSFDYNSTAIEFYGANIHILNSHFEQPSAQIFFEPYGYADLSIRDSTILVQASTGSEKYILSTWPQALNLYLDNVSIWSNHPVQYFMRSQGAVSGVVTNLRGNGNHKIAAFSEASKTPSLSPSQVF